MKQSTVVLAFCGVALMAYPVIGTPFPADEIILLPDPPSPEYTNHAEGTVTLEAPPDDYIIMVENVLDYCNWKEWIITYTFTPTDEDWLADLHVDYAFQVPGEDPPLFDHLTIGTDTAFWQTAYFTESSEPPPPDTWTAVGYPFSIGEPLKVDPSQADLVINTDPFCYNPEWVSLEFEGGNVQVGYTFYDWCIPEPTTLALLALGSLLVARRRR